MQSEEFFHELYMETYKGLYQYIRRVSKGNHIVEDILQETYFEAYKQRELLEHHENKVGWLYKTASLKLRNYMRQRELQNINLDSLNDIEDASNDYVEAEWMLALGNILTEKDKALFYQYYMEGYTGSEISQRLGITEECLKVRIHRMKKKIQKKLKDDDVGSAKGKRRI